MKYLIIAILALTTLSNSYSQNKDQLNILDKFIIAHNDGSEEAIKQFIIATYLPEIYEKIDLNAHIAFYKQIGSEFGPLNKQVYYTLEETEHTVIVHLIKKNKDIKSLFINPEDILQVEVVLSKKNTKYMEHSLSLNTVLYEDKRQ